MNTKEIDDLIFLVLKSVDIPVNSNDNVELYDKSGQIISSATFEGYGVAHHQNAITHNQIKTVALISLSVPIVGIAGNLIYKIYLAPYHTYEEELKEFERMFAKPEPESTPLKKNVSTCE